MQEMERVSTTELRRNLAKLVRGVHSGKRLIIDNQQIPLAMMISYGEAKKLKLVD